VLLLLLLLLLPRHCPWSIQAQEQFGFLLGAFDFGAPPHGGLAFGLDRLCTILGGQTSIRNYIAFPKNNMGRCMMIDSPSAITDEQLKELSINVSLKGTGPFLFFLHASLQRTTPRCEIRWTFAPGRGDGRDQGCGGCGDGGGGGGPGGGGGGGGGGPRGG
jgi:hypothetical protein